MNAAQSLPAVDAKNIYPILASAADLSLVISGQGLVKAVLPGDHAASFGDLHYWTDRPLIDFLTFECHPKLQSLLKKFAKGFDGSVSVEMNHADAPIRPFPIRYSVHRAGQDGDLLMLGRDLRQVAETQQQLVQAQLALERGYEERREFEARYRMLMSATRDAIVIVSIADGRIRDLNGAAASILGSSREDLEGAAFAQAFKDRRRTEFIESLLNLAVSETASEMAALSRSGSRSINIAPTLFRAAGERYLLCRLDPEETAGVEDDRLSLNLNTLFRAGKDAIVFTDAKGSIEAANEAFFDLIDLGNTSDIKGRNLADYLARGQIDMNVLLENAARSGHMRVYSTRLRTEFGGWTPAEISVTVLSNRAHTSIAFLVRDSGRAEAMRSTFSQQADEAAQQNVAELVGSATLKEIVSQTSDVIEKLCIETAIALTHNNRAAAAEMLGLSRQSLYVKLRKYGLHDREDRVD